MKICLNEALDRLEVTFPGKVDPAGVAFTYGRAFDFPHIPEMGRQAQIRLDDDGFVREVFVTGLASIVGEMLGPKAKAHVAKTK